MPRRAKPARAAQSIPMFDEVSRGGLLHPCAFPGIVSVAAVALRAVLTQVPVIFVVTGPALLRHLYRAGRLAMAIGALQFTVGTQQRKMRLLGMIKNPQRPSVGRMTALAFLAEAAFVHVIVRMAVDACRRRPAEGQRPVTL